MTWFKILNPDYSQARGRREMFERFHEPRSHSKLDARALTALDSCSLCPASKTYRSALIFRIEGSPSDLGEN